MVSYATFLVPLWNLRSVPSGRLDRVFPLHVEALERPLGFVANQVALQVILSLFQGFVALLATRNVQAFLKWGQRNRSTDPLI